MNVQYLIMVIVTLLYSRSITAGDIEQRCDNVVIDDFYNSMQYLNSGDNYNISVINTISPYEYANHLNAWISNINDNEVNCSLIMYNNKHYDGFLIKECNYNSSTESCVVQVNHINESGFYQFLCNNTSGNKLKTKICRRTVTL